MSTPNTAKGAVSIINGTLFLDQNADGSYEAGDVVLLGQTVGLLSAAGALLGATTTDAYGNYSFTGLASATYSVQFAAPSGDMFSPPGRSATLADSAVNARGQTAAITLNGQAVTGVDAAVYAPVSLSGTVFGDANDNGLVDGTDAGIGGVTVALLGATGAATGQTAVSAANGSYSFTGLLPGIYAAQVALPASKPGAVFSPVGGNTAPQPTGGTVTTEQNLLVNGNFNGVVPGGYSLAGAFAGWTQSANTPATPFGSGPGNGIELAVTDGSIASAQQPGGGANPYAGVVSPDSANPNYYGGPVTDAAFFVDDGALQTLSQSVNLTGGQAYEVGFDALETLPGRNNPGPYQLSAAITGASGTQVITVAGSNSGTQITPGVWEHFADLFTPAATGRYTLTFTYTSGTPNSGIASKDVLVDDVYIVPGQQTASLTTTSEVNAGGVTTPVTLTSGQTVGNESAGIYAPPASITGTVFRDLNADGVQQAGDPGLAGQTVDLLDASGGLIASTTTSSNGNYSFANVAPGTDSVQVIGLAGDNFSTPMSVPVTVAYGGHAVVNAGEYTQASLGGTVFSDTNGNGVMDPAEQPIAGDRVTLLNAAGAQIATTITAADGTYSFANLTPGTYGVQVAARPDALFSPMGTAPPPAIDSVVNATGAVSVSVISGEADGAVNAGMYPTGAISSFVFLDGQADGIYHVGDPGIAGVAVQLLDAAGQPTAQTTTTNASGGYSFSGLALGGYQVRVLAPAGTGFSTPENAGPNSLLDSNINPVSGISGVITVQAGATSAGANAGLVFNGNFANTTPTWLGLGQTHDGNAGSGVVVGPGGNIVHTGSGGDSIVVLGNQQAGNLVEAGGGSEIVTSAGALSAQTQTDTSSAFFSGGSGSANLQGEGGTSYLMGGTGNDLLAAGGGDSVLIAGGNSATVQTVNGVVVGHTQGDELRVGGNTTTIEFQKGDGVITIDGGLRAQDRIEVFGYTAAMLQTVNGQQALYFGGNDLIVFNGGYNPGLGAIRHSRDITAPPAESVVFGANGLPSIGPVAGAVVIPAPTVAAAPKTVAATLVTQLVVTPPVVSLPVVSAPVTLAGVQSPPASTPTPTPTPPAPATVVMSGWNQVLSLGDANSDVSGSQGNSRLSVGNGDNSIRMDGWNNVITTGGGRNSIEAGNGNETVDTTSGNDTVLLSGWSNLVIGGIGADMISGGAGNVYQVNATGSVGGMTISDFGTASNDVLDLSKILSASGWNGSNATLGQFVRVAGASDGSTTVAIDSTGHGAGFATVATLGGAQAGSISDLIAHHALRLG